MLKKIVIPLPRQHFDPTEVAIPWKILTQNQVQVIFSTPDGKMPFCDERMLTGKGLGVFGPLLKADKNARTTYDELLKYDGFINPLRWSDILNWEFDGLLLPGGHDKGMREYLESEALQKIVSIYFESERPVGAICHGTVLVARSKGKNGKSVLFGRKTTALLCSQEILAWALTFIWCNDYYRTYSITVEEEVKAALGDAADFIKGSLPIFRDSPQKSNRGFALQDRNYISARWPGDAHAFANKFLEILLQKC